MLDFLAWISRKILWTHPNTLVQWYIQHSDYFFLSCWRLINLFPFSKISVFIVHFSPRAWNQYMYLRQPFRPKYIITSTFGESRHLDWDLSLLYGCYLKTSLNALSQVFVIRSIVRLNSSKPAFTISWIIKKIELRWVFHALSSTQWVGKKHYLLATASPSLAYIEGWKSNREKNKNPTQSWALVFPSTSRA